ncbi:MAG: PAS domain-containing protein [Halanaerobiales bacterium]|nr:PAS domain-containing protein [Halanaerobiales bacterium]
MEWKYILEGTDAGTWEWNVQTGKTIFNEIWAKMIGYTLKEISPTTIETWKKFTHPDDLEKVEKMLEEHFNGEIDQYKAEIRMKHKKGHWVWMLDQGKVISWTEDGKPLRMFGIHMDITERKQKEEKSSSYLFMIN